VGPARHRALRGEAGLAAALAAVASAERERALAEAARILARAASVGTRLLVAGTPPYPESLLDLGDAPPVLFSLGDAAVLRAPVVAVVGTRRPTRYGERVARELVDALARSGATVVSGLAVGIDGIAHRTALDANGRTVAVLGTGADVAYPAAHTALHREVVERGLVLSEHPPGERATAGSFPRRNRIIAALASVTIVVEAGARSGALITAGHALDLGRTVAAVPGAIDSPQSAGTNELLRDGAAVIASVADAIALAGTTPPAAAPRRSLTADEQVVWDALAPGAADLDVLAARTRLPAARCLAAVTTLELDGAVECALTGEVRRR
jgi:DNA processing protein